MEISEDAMGAHAPRILPPGVPADAEPVTEEQLERLPDYVQHIIADSMNGMTAPTTHEELLCIRDAFFNAAPAAIDEAKAAGKDAECVSSNSMECEDE